MTRGAELDNLIGTNNSEVGTVIPFLGNLQVGD
jgi:hypothetical protein